MTDIITQDPIDEFDDLRSLAEEDTTDELDDLRSLGEDKTTDEISSEDEPSTVVEEASIDEISSDEMSDDTDDAVADVTNTGSDNTDANAKDDKHQDKIVAEASEPTNLENDTTTDNSENDAVEKPSAPQPMMTSATKSEPVPKPMPVTNSDEYVPSMALRAFLFLREVFIKIFDIVLTGVAIVIERLTQLDWVGYWQAVTRAVQSADAFLANRVPPKARYAVYGLFAFLMVGVPIITIAISMTMSSNNNIINGQTITNNLNQPVVVSNGIIAPLFTPTVQDWASDFERWTADSIITPDMLAIVVQLNSCGLQTAERGLFGVSDINTATGDLDAEATIAISRLENALAQTNGDFAFAMALYADGERILTDDFATWTFHARDMFILGRSIHRQVERGWVTSPDIDSWLLTTGAVLCSNSYTTASN